MRRGGILVRNRRGRDGSCGRIGDGVWFWARSGVGKMSLIVIGTVSLGCSS